MQVIRILIDLYPVVDPLLALEHHNTKPEEINFRSHESTQRSRANIYSKFELAN